MSRRIGKGNRALRQPWRKINRMRSRLRSVLSRRALGLVMTPVWPSDGAEL